MATISEALALAAQHRKAGRLPEAEQIYRQILSIDPDHADALNMLGILAHDAGRHNLAIELIQRAISLKGDVWGFHYNLAKACQEQGNPAEAVAGYRRVLELNPTHAATHNNLGNALGKLGKLDQAIASYQQALRLQPDYAIALNNLGTALTELGRYDEAVGFIEQSLRLQPAQVAAHVSLGNVWNKMGKLDEAVLCFRRALELKPHSIEAHLNLGNTFKDQGYLTEAIDCIQQALAIKPDYVQAHDNLLVTLPYRIETTPDQLPAAHAEFNRRFANPLAPLNPEHPNDRSPNRRLRVGYVSPDFREHVVGRGLLPLFRQHDHQQFDVFCYAQVRRRDEFTDRFQNYSDAWRNIMGLSDESVAQWVHDDQIDILVDLAMHTADNRLLTLARKPAPVQITYAGLLGTTGLSAIDYRLTDPYLDPPGLFDHCYSEKSFPLHNTFWCYDPPGQEPAVNPLPAREKGYVTFGCLNAFFKINVFVLKLWARVMRRVERSQLLLLAPAGVARQKTLDLLAREGVARDRVTFASRQPHRQYLELYHQIDIGLDTFPYNGHATSLDSYWMGVPVITLVGSTVVGRAGLSQLMNLKLSELIAESPDQFVRIVAELAHDLPRLAELRLTLRARMEASPLMDAPVFARGIEAAYRTMWQRWCARE